MSRELYIALPYTYKNKVLTIKALGCEETGETVEAALLNFIQEKIFYYPMILSEFNEREVHIPFDDKIMNKITEIEPYPADKKKEIRGFLAAPTSEETVKFGY